MLSFADTSDHYADFRWCCQPEQLRSLSEDLQWQTQESQWLQHTRHFLHVARVQVKYTSISAIIYAYHTNILDTIYRYIYASDKPVTSCKLFV